MKITSLKFEGTSEEFKAVAHMFEGSPPKSEEGPEEEIKVDAKDAIRKMIERRTLPNGQRQLYLALIDGPMEYNDFLEKMKRTPRQMTGVIGALGKRVNATEEVHKAGLPGDSTLVLRSYQENGKKYISLTDEVLEVIKEPEIYSLISYD